MVDITVFESSRRIRVCEDVIVYDCLVFQENVFIEEGNFVENGSSGVCDVSRC